MIPTWFHSPERIHALKDAIKSWIGTPFFRASCSKGQGVDCTHFVGAIYREVGCCDVNVPPMPVSSSKFIRESLVVPFMNTLPNFVNITSDLLNTGERYGKPGDLIGIKVGRVIHHLGILVDDARFAHVLDRVTLSAITDATWASRLSAVWRPQP